MSLLYLYLSISFLFLYISNILVFFCSLRTIFFEHIEFHMNECVCAIGMIDSKPYIKKKIVQFFIEF